MSKAARGSLGIPLAFSGRNGCIANRTRHLAGCFPRNSGRASSLFCLARLPSSRKHLHLPQHVGHFENVAFFDFSYHACSKRNRAGHTCVLEGAWPGPVLSVPIMSASPSRQGPLGSLAAQRVRLLVEADALSELGESYATLIDILCCKND